MAITQSSIVFGYFNRKDIVNKLPYISYDYEHGAVDPTSAHIHNYAISPAGGIVELEQDVYTSDGRKTYNYCQYVWGGLTYYGYVKATGAAGGIVTYQITCDAATTIYAAGALNLNNYIEYSSAGDALKYDARRAISPTSTRVVLNDTTNAITQHIIDGGYKFPVVINVCREPTSGVRSPSSVQASVDTYIMTPDAFTTFWMRFRSLAGQDQAKYGISILNVYMLPIMMEDITNISSWHQADSAYLYAASDNTAIEIDVRSPIPVRKNFSSPALTVTLPTLAIPASARRQPIINGSLQYQALSFGAFSLPMSKILRHDSASGYSLSCKIELDLTGSKYIATPMIGGALLPEAAYTGSFPNTSMPVLKETDLTNYGLQLATSLINAAGGMVLAGPRQDPIGLALSGIGALTDAENIAHASSYNGGTILGGLSSSIQSFSKLMYYYDYYDYDDDLPSVYNYPDFNVRNIHTSQLTGYIKTRNCQVLMTSYPNEIVKSACAAFDAGVFLT